MLGFIKKDLLLLRGNFKVMVVMLLVFSFVTFSEGSSNFIFIPSFISIMLMMTTFSYDEYNKTDAYLIALPGGKKKAVAAKYLTTLLIVLVSLLFSFVLSYIVGVVQKQMNFGETLSITLGCGAGILILQSILYPLIYKLGIEKGRVGIFLIVFGITTIGSILMKNGFSIQIPGSVTTFFDHYGFLIIPVIIVMILLLSYKVSEHIYCKKEF